MTRRIDRTADLLSRRLEQQATTIPNARNICHEQRNHIRILGTPTNEEGRSSGGHGDPTLRAVIELDRWTYLEGCIDDALESARIALNLVDQAIAAIHGRADINDTPKPRCIGDGGPNGATCWAIPDTRRNTAGMTVDDGRCLDCGRSYDQRRMVAEQARRTKRRMDKLGETA